MKNLSAALQHREPSQDPTGSQREISDQRRYMNSTIRTAKHNGMDVRRASEGCNVELRIGQALPSPKCPSERRTSNSECSLSVSSESSYHTAIGFLMRENTLENCGILPERMRQSNWGNLDEKSQGYGQQSESTAPKRKRSFLRRSSERPFYTSCIRSHWTKTKLYRYTKVLKWIWGSTKDLNIR